MIFFKTPIPIFNCVSSEDKLGLGEIIRNKSHQRLDAYILLIQNNSIDSLIRHWNICYQKLTSLFSISPVTQLLSDLITSQSNCPIHYSAKYRPIKLQGFFSDWEIGWLMQFSTNQISGLHSLLYPAWKNPQGKLDKNVGQISTKTIFHRQLKKRQNKENKIRCFTSIIIMLDWYIPFVSFLKFLITNPGLGAVPIGSI